MSKRMRWLDVNWVELGCRGWDIDATGAELVDPKEECYCHLDRVTLDIIGGGDGPWWFRALRDLADAGVPGLTEHRTWRVVGMPQNMSRSLDIWGLP